MKKREEADALALVIALRGRAEWETVLPSIQARALRVEGGLRLQQGDIIRAKELLAEAKCIDPTGVHRILEAKIAREEKDIDAALAILGDTSDPNEIPLRWNFLLECGRTAEVLTEAAQKLSGKTPECDTACAFALALVAECRADEARAVVETARAAAPKHRSLQYVAAIADYMSTLSPAFSAWRHLTWPVPVPEYFVKRDVESVRRRQTAAETFARLRANATGEERDRFLTWEIAACASDRASLVRAEDLCRNGLHENPATVPHIVWATTLGVQFDRLASASALETKINAPGATLDDVLALIGVLDDAKEGPRIDELLDRQKHLFDEREQTFLYYLHKAQVLAIRGERDAALKLLDQISEPSQQNEVRGIVLHTLATKSGKRDDFVALAKYRSDLYEKTQDGHALFAACRARRDIDDWDWIASRAEVLVEKVPTQHALELAASSLLNTRQAEKCLTLLDKYRALGPGGEWSPFTRQMAAEALKLLGRLPEAVLELEKSLAAGAGASALMQLFTTQLLAGDLIGIVQTARKLVGKPDVPPSFLLQQVVPSVQHKDPESAGPGCDSRGGLIHEIGLQKLGCESFGPTAHRCIEHSKLPQLIRSLSRHGLQTMREASVQRTCRKFPVCPLTLRNRVA